MQEKRREFPCTTDRVVCSAIRNSRRNYERRLSRGNTPVDIPWQLIVGIVASRQLAERSWTCLRPTRHLEQLSIGLFINRVTIERRIMLCFEHENYLETSRRKLITLPSGTNPLPTEREREREKGRNRGKCLVARISRMTMSTLRLPNRGTTLQFPMQRHKKEKKENKITRERKINKPLNPTGTRIRDSCFKAAMSSRRGYCRS